MVFIGKIENYLPAVKSKMSPTLAFPSRMLSICLNIPFFSFDINESDASQPAFELKAKDAPQAMAAGPQTSPATPAAATTVLFVAPEK